MHSGRGRGLQAFGFRCATRRVRHGSERSHTSCARTAVGSLMISGVLCFPAAARAGACAGFGPTLPFVHLQRVAGLVSGPTNDYVLRVLAPTAASLARCGWRSGLGLRVNSFGRVCGATDAGAGGHAGGERSGVEVGAFGLAGARGNVGAGQTAAVRQGNA